MQGLSVIMEQHDPSIWGLIPGSELRVTKHTGVPIQAIPRADRHRQKTAVLRPDLEGPIKYWLSYQFECVTVVCLSDGEATMFYLFHGIKRLPFKVKRAVDDVNGSITALFDKLLTRSSSDYLIAYKLLGSLFVECFSSLKSLQQFDVTGYYKNMSFTGKVVWAPRGSMDEVYVTSSLDTEDSRVINLRYHPFQQLHLAVDKERRKKQ